MVSLRRNDLHSRTGTGPDGSTPEYVWCIDDEATFNKANSELSALIISAGLEDGLNAARAALKTAEDRLIAYGLSLAPAGLVGAVN